MDICDEAVVVLDIEWCIIILGSGVGDGLNLLAVVEVTCADDDGGLMIDDDGALILRHCVQITSFPVNVTLSPGGNGFLVTTMS